MFYIFLLVRFGFIRFDDIGSATQALKQLNYTEVDGKTIELRYAEDRSEGGGRGGGGRGGGRGRGRGELLYTPRPVRIDAPL